MSLTGSALSRPYFRMKRTGMKNEPTTATQAPCVVFTLPFAPTMVNKSALDNHLRSAMAEAERELLAHHPRQIALPVIRRMEETVKGLNYSTHHKSLVVQADLESSKALYLDIPVQPSVQVDREFQIRQLTVPPGGHDPFLLLLLDSKVSRMFHFDGCRLHLIKDNGFHPVYAYTHRLPERVANFTDASSIKEQLLEKFLRHMDDGLSIILETYPLPVFVMGTERVVGHFKGITRNTRHIAVYIHKNGMHATEAGLVDLLQPYMDDWEAIRQQMALQQVEGALEAGKLTAGMEAVRKAVGCRNNRLLIAEKRFFDGIDPLIEKVLEAGGTVSWVEDGGLAAQEGIALIRYY